MKTANNKHHEKKQSKKIYLVLFSIISIVFFGFQVYAENLDETPDTQQVSEKPNALNENDLVDVSIEDENAGNSDNNNSDDANIPDPVNDVPSDQSDDDSSDVDQDQNNSEDIKVAKKASESSNGVGPKISNTENNDVTTQGGTGPPQGKKIDIKVEKKWVNAPNQLPEVQVQLLRNNNVVDTVTLNSSNGWSKIWRNLDKSGGPGQGNNYTYTVREINVPDEYKSVTTSSDCNLQQSGNKKDDKCFTITNTYENPKVNIKVDKEWIGKRDNNASIKAQLVRNGSEVHNNFVVLNNGNGWSNEWTNLPKNDSSGNAYDYTVVEKEVPAGYTSSVKEVDCPTDKGGQGSNDKYDKCFLITNKYNPKIDIEVEKKWVNAPNQKPSVKVELLRDGNVYDTKTLNNSNGWKYEWQDLPQVNTDTNEDYTYTVKEKDVPADYVSTVSECPAAKTGTGGDDDKADKCFVITNQYNPKIDIDVEKKWVNGSAIYEDLDIQVQLYQNGNAYGEPISLDKDNDWKGNWNNLPKYDLSNDSEYTYTVKEINVPDNFNSSVKECDVDKGRTGDPDKADKCFVITNEYVSPKIDIEVEKKWVNGPVNKPDVTVELLRDGDVHKTKVLNDGNEWYHKWEDLDKTDADGNDYLYEIKEVEVLNYISTIEECDVDIVKTGGQDKADKCFVITNEYVSPKIDIEVEKKWVNGPVNKPDVTVELLRDGDVYKTIVLNDGNEWYYKWEGLDKTDTEGNEYLYEINEVDVLNYISTIEECDVDKGKTGGQEGKADKCFVITNEYVSPKIDVKVNKEWIGGPKNKPAIEVQLYRNGEAYLDVVILNSENGWEYIWSELDETDGDGVLYEYTIKELKIPANYESKVSKEGNSFLIKNTYKDGDPEKDPGEKDKDKKEIGGLDGGLPSSGQNIGFIVAILLAIGFSLVALRKYFS